jgi:trehalose synthase
MANNRNSVLDFAEQFFPARPRRLWSQAQTLVRRQIYPRRIGLPNSFNPAYINWLRNESMLKAANSLAAHYSGRGSMWQNPFAQPQPRRAVAKTSVWYTAYPISLVTKEKQSFLRTLADEKLWAAFQEIGINGVHTGPVKQAGGISGWGLTPSIDGHFDRISTKIDRLFGTEAEFRHMSEVANRHGGTIIDDVVPGHTGKGADFRLAEMNYGSYPGIYHMVGIHPQDWHLLPEVPKGADSANIDTRTEDVLAQLGYIIGALQRVIFYQPGVKETNWSATKAVRGVDGKKRRWVYLHYFKEGQPSLNWLDPSFTGMKLVVGDALHSLGELGSGGLRLDANGFLGIEKRVGGQPAWSEGHPLSEAANQLIAGMVRKVGGFTFQELNLSIDDIKTMSESGADLSYDFINRPAYHHALATGQAGFLRLTLKASLQAGIDPASLIHGLQNHDELTYELIHFERKHEDDEFIYQGKKLKGSELASLVRKDLQDALTSAATPYNLTFTSNGIACTNVSAIAAILKISDLNEISAEDAHAIQRAHLLLALFNALQPGVFALSGWDLCGSLVLPAEKVKDLIATGDTRWINRGGHDLMGVQPEATQSMAGIPIASNLYGTLPQQLSDELSFARQLQTILKVRKVYGLAMSHQIDIPEVSNPAILAMLHLLPDHAQLQVTVLNFSREPASARISSSHIPAGTPIIDMFTGTALGVVSKQHDFEVTLSGHQGMSLLLSQGAPIPI